MDFARRMSAHQVMASINRSLGTRQNIRASNEVKLAHEGSIDRLYEPKDKQKLIRVMTVIAYLISVSLAAIILSLYYTFIWDPKDHNKNFIHKPANSSKVESGVTNFFMENNNSSQINVINNYP